MQAVAESPDDPVPELQAGLLEYRIQENIEREHRKRAPFGTDIYGELTLAGAKTSLYLQDKEDFNTHAIPDQCVKGILHDLTKITLMQSLLALSQELA